MPRAAAIKPSPQELAIRSPRCWLRPCSSWRVSVARRRSANGSRRRDIEEMSEERMSAMAADAMLLSADLLLSQPP